jgi:hypothetical protein
MSHIRLSIDRLVLRGFEPPDGKALAQALETQLSQVLSNRSARGEWARSHRMAVLKLGRMPIEAGTAGARKFGKLMAHAVGRGLKP